MQTTLKLHYNYTETTLELHSNSMRCLLRHHEYNAYIKPIFYLWKTAKFSREFCHQLRYRRPFTTSKRLNSLENFQDYIYLQTP